jgi:hypothetical protein
MLGALHFPPIEELLEWKDIAGIPGFNKVALLCVVSGAITFLFFWKAGRRARLSVC